MKYCFVVLGSTLKYEIQQVFTLQKKALRIVNKTGCNDHANKLPIHVDSLKT